MWCWYSLLYKDIKCVTFLFFRRGQRVCQLLTSTMLVLYHFVPILVANRTQYELPILHHDHHAKCVVCIWGQCACFY